MSKNLIIVESPAKAKTNQMQKIKSKKECTFSPLAFSL